MHMAEERKIIFLHSSSFALLHECYSVKLTPCNFFFWYYSYLANEQLVERVS